MLKFFWLVCAFIVVGSKAGSVPFIRPCMWSDKDCILESTKIALPYFVKGIPELDILPVDPIYIQDISTDSGDLKLQFKDLSITGLAKTVFTKSERPNADKTVLLEFESPIVGRGKYKAGGKIFILDVFGHGETEIKCDKIRVQAEIRLKKTEKGGKQYYKVSSFDYTYEPLERVYYKFTNLYEGDEKKAQLLLDLVNQNWKELLFEIGKPVIEEIVKQLVSRANKFIQAVSVDELEISQ